MGSAGDGDQHQHQRQRLVILAGAPTQSALEQSPAALSRASPYLPAFRRFLKIGGDEIEPSATRLLPAPDRGQGDKGHPWRELPLKGDGKLGITTDAIPQVPLPERVTVTAATTTGTLRLPADPTSEAQTDDDQAAAAQLLHDDEVAAKSHADGAEDVDEDFLNHSFSCYNTATTSSDEYQVIAPQFPAIPHEDSLDLNYTLHRSFTFFHTPCDGTAASRPTRLPSILPSLPPLSSLTDLEDLPPPKELERLQSHSRQIYPKPISTIVGIISISQPIICRNGSEMVKLVVGDETASGVGVTIWLDSAVGIRDKLRKGTLRPLDVVLLRNFSMNVYAGKVYLNSMRKRAEAELLYRCGDRIGGCGIDLVQEGAFKDQQLEKVRRVVGWIVGFVRGWSSEGAAGTEGDQTVLPEDTQFDRNLELP